MSFLLAGFAIVAIAGFLLLLDRKDRRHAAQVADLCQRVQAPETAVAQHFIQQRDQPAHLPFGDDAAWIEYENGMGAS